MEATPNRPRSHALETKSKRMFESALPEDWVITDAGDDYGVDLRVEIFENETTTGLQFNVQLKATDGVVVDRTVVKRETLNYWETLPAPTLLVIAHAPSESLRFAWMHLYPLKAAETKSITIAASRVLDASASADVVEEVRAYFLARRLWQHYPVPIVLNGTDLNGQSVLPVKRELRRIIRKVPSLAIVTDSPAAAPHALLQFLGDRVEVSISGTPSRTLTWGGIDTEEHKREIAADLCSALGVAAGALGAADLAVALFKLAAPHSGMLAETSALPDVIRLLAQTGNQEAILQIVRRTVCVEDHPSAYNVLAAAVIALQNEDHKAILSAVGWALRDAVQTWSAPARPLYNAAGMLADEDPEEATRLYDAAAAADPAYLDRGYWWWEKGRAFWKAQEPEEAEACYRQAIALGENRATGPLADVLLRTGRFSAALALLDTLDMYSEPADAQWRLTRVMLTYLKEDLKIDDQNPADWPAVGFEPVPGPDLHERAMRSLSRNAIDWWAHAAMATTAEAQSRTLASVAGALCILSDPSLWLRVVEWAMVDDALDGDSRMAIAQDALFCAWVYTNDDFKEAVEDDPFLADGLKQAVIGAFDAIRPGSPIPELRLWNDDTGEQILMD